MTIQAKVKRNYDSFKATDRLSERPRGHYVTSHAFFYGRYDRRIESNKIKKFVSEIGGCRTLTDAIKSVHSLLLDSSLRYSKDFTRGIRKDLMKIIIDKDIRYFSKHMTLGTDSLVGWFYAKARDEVRQVREPRRFNDIKLPAI